MRRRKIIQKTKKLRLKKWDESKNLRGTTQIAQKSATLSDNGGLTVPPY